MGNRKNWWHLYYDLIINNLNGSPVAAHLSRIVKQETEMTVLQWINSFRIKHAKQLLRYTRMNMSEIAFDLHFTSAEYFRYFFRRETGISPMEYRKS